MLAAYESALRQSAKDDAEWQRIRSRLYAEPPQVKRERLRSRQEGRSAAPRVGLSLDTVQALLAGAAAADASYGAAYGT